MSVVIATLLTATTVGLLLMWADTAQPLVLLGVTAAFLSGWLVVGRLTWNGGPTGSTAGEHRTLQRRCDDAEREASRLRATRDDLQERFNLMASDLQRANAALTQLSLQARDDADTAADELAARRQQRRV